MIGRHVVETLIAVGLCLSLTTAGFAQISVAEPNPTFGDRVSATQDNSVSVEKPALVSLVSKYLQELAKHFAAIRTNLVIDDAGATDAATLTNSDQATLELGITPARSGSEAWFDHIAQMLDTLRDPLNQSKTSGSSILTLPDIVPTHPNNIPN